MYKVKLENFAGPLDLLLYFIRRDEIDVYDIPIAQITAEYMETIDMMQTLNLNFAGEFILMAATLMRIKAKMLLPKPQLSDEDEVEDDEMDTAPDVDAEGTKMYRDDDEAGDEYSDEEPEVDMGDEEEEDEIPAEGLSLIHI